MKTVIAIIVIALLGWGAYALMDKDVVEVPASAPVVTESETQLTPDQVIAPREAKEFTVVGKNFSFSPSTITVKKGDRVKIVFQNQGGNHDWVVDEFSSRTKVLSAGQSETIEFVADKSGSFEYYCSVGTHRQMGMKGTLVVE